MKKIDKFGFISILITIVLLNIYIGSNIKSPIWIIQIFMSFVSIIYIILKKMSKFRFFLKKFRTVKKKFKKSGFKNLNLFLIYGMIMA